MEKLILFLFSFAHAHTHSDPKVSSSHANIDKMLPITCYKLKRNAVEVLKYNVDVYGLKKYN